MSELRHKHVPEVCFGKTAHFALILFMRISYQQHFYNESLAKSLIHHLSIPSSSKFLICISARNMSLLSLSLVTWVYSSNCTGATMLLTVT